MRAIVQDVYGTADVLQFKEIETPEIGEDDVLVRVAAAGVHRGIWHTMTGLPYLMRVMGFGLRAPKARVRGDELAGQVEAVGANVTRFQVGDEVFGTSDGAYAELARAHQDSLAHKPRNLSFEQASLLPVSASAALRALRDAGGVAEGQSVLIVGASGGVGTFAVQIAKAFGAEVTGVCSTRNLDLVRSLGADHVIDYTRDEFTELDRRYDLMVDLAGNRPLSALRRALTPDGTLVIVGGEGGGRWFGGVDRQLRAMLTSPFVSQNLRSVFVATTAEDLRQLRDLAEGDQLEPVVDQTFTLARAADAIRYLTDGHPHGKVAVAV